MSSIAYLTSYVPKSVNKTFIQFPLHYDTLRTGFVFPKGATQRITATLAGPEAAAILALEVGSALVSLTRVLIDADGNANEHLFGLYRPDFFDFHLSIKTH